MWAKPNCAPLGLGYIASTLRDAGHSAKILDINIRRDSREDTLASIINAKPDVVMTGGIITVYNYLRWLTVACKKYANDVPIVVGGSVSTSIPKIALENLNADIACIGEGEITCVEIANKLSQGDDLGDVRGIWYKDEKGNIIPNKPRPPIKDMDTIPFPAYDLMDMETYVKNPVGYINKDKWGSGEATTEAPFSTNINVTRGCPYKCGFCYHDYLGPGYRHRSPTNILAEMDLLHDTYGVTYFLWADDEAVINRKFIHEFCELMIDTGREYQFALSGRVNLMTRQMLNELKAAGCNMVAYGIESGSQKMLDAMNKNVTVEQAKKAVKMTQETFGDADCTFMIGYPGETDETIRETIEFCKELNLAPESIFFATPYPGTPLYEYALKHEYITDEEKYISELNEQGENVSINFTNWSDEELINKQKSMIRELKAWNVKRHEQV
jgi:radical SAM superfamily enzyme YgiQ (UPF0313 family)